MAEEGLQTDDIQDTCRTIFGPWGSRKRNLTTQHSQQSYTLETRQRLQKPAPLVKLHSASGGAKQYIKTASFRIAPRQSLRTAVQSFIEPMSSPNIAELLLKQKAKKNQLRKNMTIKMIRIQDVLKNIRPKY